MFTLSVDDTKYDSKTWYAGIVNSGIILTSDRTYAQMYETAEQAQEHACRLSNKYHINFVVSE